MAMDRNSADAFVYAKASGMLARSFTGEKALQLFNVHSLKELWSLVFKTDVPVIPEKLLARALETEAQRRFMNEYMSLIENYQKPDKILISLLRIHDYNNLKQIAAALYFGEKDIPEMIDISPYNLINYSKWPNIEEMTKGSELEWYNKVPQLSEQQANDYKLDSQFIKEVWSTLKHLSPSCKKPVTELLEYKFKMQNLIWALRLRVYYEMPKEEILKHLVFVEKDQDESDPVAGAAVKILDWPVDSYEPWKNWKYQELLNPHTEGTVWNLDPRWVYNSAHRNFVTKAKKMFHLYPFTVCPLVCWYIIKQSELDTIRTASESLRMNFNTSQAIKLAGISEENNG